ncbi:MAG: hypothetical protein M9964_15290 [Solirubrobacterales bacterium]|nr:hypothetical protein [Solirubrobacterales bacterium]
MPRLRVLRTSWHELLLLGLLLFVPLGLSPRSSLRVTGSSVDRLDDPHLLTAVPLGVAQVVAPLLGTVLFAAAVLRGLRHRGQEVGGVIDLARSLPYWS